MFCFNLLIKPNYNHNFNELNLTSSMESFGVSVVAIETHFGLLRVGSSFNICKCPMKIYTTNHIIIQTTPTHN